MKILFLILLQPAERHNFIKVGSQCSDQDILNVLIFNNNKINTVTSDVTQSRQI